MGFRGCEKIIGAYSFWILCSYAALRFWISGLYIYFSIPFMAPWLHHFLLQLSEHWSIIALGYMESGCGVGYSTKCD